MAPSRTPTYETTFRGTTTCNSVCTAPSCVCTMRGTPESNRHSIFNPQYIISVTSVKLAAPPTPSRNPWATPPARTTPVRTLGSTTYKRCALYAYNIMSLGASP
eukprot:733573-Rhodomonas_salina.2